jgi:hypothetical protein
MNGGDMKHTPGPWQLVKRHDRNSYIIVRGGATTHVKSEADARLMALAPDMYDYIEQHAADGDEHALSLVWQVQGAFK